MAIQLSNIPTFKINGQELEGFTFLSFKLTKRLLEPNRFEFKFRKDNMTLTQDDIKFELREQLLGALVECSLKAYREDENGDSIEYEVDSFFKGYIQNVKVERTQMKTPMVVHCVAYTPDARIKQFPGCSCRTNATLKEYIDDILMHASAEPHKFNPDGGEYDVIDYMNFETNPRYEVPMPYTVQYRESDYDFIKRMAKRYGEFFYFEDDTIHFGKMKEYDPITLRTGFGIENYEYDLNMNHHTGAALCEWDYNMCNRYMAGIEKGNVHNWRYKIEPFHEMSKSAFEHSVDYFNSSYNAIMESHTARIMHEDVSKQICGAWKEGEQKDIDANECDFWTRDQRRILEQYVMADTLICTGEACRADLKLGSVIVIEDQTKLEDGTCEYVQHEPLKIIDLTYEWKEDSVRSVDNTFKAIPQKATVPPYLERDEQGFLTYGDFDIYPHCGPQHGRVYDNKDPLGIGRVRVVLNWQYQVKYSDGVVTDLKDEGMKDNITPWIRVAQPYAGWKKGCYLVPEIYDEVIVDFEFNNAECPYVAGTVHNWYVDEVNKSWVEEASVKDNEYKAIRTRNGHTIEIRDKGEHGYIKIYDEYTHNYVVTYDTDNKLIRLKSKGNIELVADNDIVLNAGNDIIMEAKNDIDLYAENDIRRTADHDVWDTEGNDYANCVGNDFNTWIKDTNAHIHLIKDRIQLELHDQEKKVILEQQGVSVNSDNIIAIQSKDKVGVNGKNMAVLKSDMEVDIKGKQLNMEGEIEANLKAAICKIN